MQRKLIIYAADARLHVYRSASGEVMAYEVTSGNKYWRFPKEESARVKFEEVAGQ